MENQKNDISLQNNPLAAFGQNDSMDHSDDNSGFLTSSIRKAIENVDDPEFQKNYGRFIPFFQRISTYLNRRRQFQNIVEHLEYADFVPEVAKRPNYLYLTFNAFFLFGFIGTFKVFKRNSIRLVSVLSLMVLKSHYLDFYAAENHLRNIALDHDDLVAQEIRNLYRFYLPDDPDIPEMVEKCEEFKKVAEIRKMIKSKKDE